MSQYFEFATGKSACIVIQGINSSPKTLSSATGSNDNAGTQTVVKVNGMETAIEVVPHVSPTDSTDSDQEIKIAGSDSEVPIGAIPKAAQAAVDHAQETFDKAVERLVHSQANAFVKALSTSINPPSKAEISFALTMDADLGSIVIGKVGAEATFNVTLTWEKPKSE